MSWLIHRSWFAPLSVLMVIALSVMWGAPVLAKGGAAQSELMPITIKPLKRSFDQCRAAAEGGDVQAMLELAWRFETASGTTKDEAASARWLGKGAESGNVDAQVYLASRLAHGVGVLQDQRKALDLYAKAAEQGHPQAQYEMGRAAAEDPEKAFAWFSKAADQGHAQAQVEAALSYLDGRGVDSDPEAAIDLLIKADQCGSVIAAGHLGKVYRQGLGVDANPREALKWFSKAASLGDLEAGWTLAQMYEAGDGIPKDSNKSLMWLRKLTEKKHHEAQIHLAAVSPEIFKDIAKPVAKKHLTIDRYIGGPVVIEARIHEKKDSKWHLALPGEEFTVYGDAARLRSSDGVQEGQFVTIYGILGLGETIEMLLVEKVRPSLEWSYELQLPKGGIRAGKEQTFVVAGVVKNTGKQPINFVKASVRIYQQSSPNDGRATLEFKDFRPGEQRQFRVTATMYNYQYAGATSKPKVEFKVDEVKW